MIHFLYHYVLIPILAVLFLIGALGYLVGKAKRHRW